MQTLSSSDLQIVSGGAGEPGGSRRVSNGDALSMGGAIGGGIGLSIAIAKGATSVVCIGAATIGTFAGVAVVASGLVGWEIGTALYEAISV